MKELLLLSALGIVVLILEVLKWRKPILPVVILGLMGFVFLCAADFEKKENVYNMLYMDKTAMLICILIGIIGIFWFVLARPYLNKTSHISDYTSLVIFSMVGAMVLASYINMTMLFLGIEILSIPVYILAGSNKGNIASNEASFKYFLMGAFASSFLLLGIAFLYGATSSFDIRSIGVSALNDMTISLRLLVIGLLLVLFALAFKASAVPFHFWAPDVYTGAPTPVTAYMATIIKIAALAAFIRLFGMALGLMHGLYAAITLIIAVLTIVVGNVLAVSQDNIKRLLAYSGVGHAGFVILAIAIQQNISVQVSIYYLIGYAISAIAAFWVVTVVAKSDEDIEAFNGLVHKHPLLAGTLTLSLLSMAGIPPLAGFFGKYFVLINAIIAGYTWVAVIAILASLIGVYYYLRVLIAVFFGKPEGDAKITIDVPTAIGLAVLCLLLIGIGLYPEFVFSLLK